MYHGDLLQHIAARGKRDHRPLDVLFRCRLTYTPDTNPSVLWDHQKLHSCLMAGENRYQFLEQVEQELEQDPWTPRTASDPNVSFHKLNAVVKSVAILVLSTLMPPPLSLMNPQFMICTMMPTSPYPRPLPVLLLASSPTNLTTSPHLRASPPIPS